MQKKYKDLEHEEQAETQVWTFKINHFFFIFIYFEMSCHNHNKKKTTKVSLKLLTAPM